MKGRSVVSFWPVGLFLFLWFPLAARGAAVQLNPNDPIGFFTNIASRLLQSEFNLSLTRIQIYPTNKYTPAVHRLLQVAANIYESATNRFDDAYPHLPTVFRPRFTNDGGSVFVCGYVEETNSLFLTNTLRDLISSDVANAVQPDDRILGVPPILGAKKGLPNFNEFSMETVFQITRKVELRKSAPGGASMIIETNQMFVLGISNVFGAEFWNSYTTDFPRSVDVFVTNYCTLTFTNDYGYARSSNLVAFGAVSNLSTWRAWDPRRTAPPTTGPWSFIVPMRTNHVILPDSVYRFLTTNFSPLTTTFERPSGFAFPRWGLTIANRLLGVIIAHDTGRIVDYVQLNRLIMYRDLSLDIADPLPGNQGVGGFRSLWATNTLPGQPSQLSDFLGVYQQILVSGGNDWGFNPGQAWQIYGLNQPVGQTRDQAIANFLAFFENDHTYIYMGDGGMLFSGTNLSLVTVVPFTPTKKFSIPMIWQANDPLAHYMSGDMQDLEKSGVLDWWIPLGSATRTNLVANLSRLNNRYQPWGDYPNSPENDSNAFNLAFKDPLVLKADCWNFPVSEPLSLATLARVHRGTPWQTIYLKSTEVDPLSWRTWTGNTNSNDAPHSRPTRDWPLAASLASLLNTNDPRHLVSVNEPATNTWLAVLDGIVALINSVGDDALIPGCSPQLDSFVVSSNLPQSARLEAAIRSARAAQLSQRFFALGDVLAVPQLSITSPWLNRCSDAQLRDGINDEAYERLPVQLLARLRPDSVGSILASNGVLQIQFTGFDGYPYALQASSNLVDWIPVSISYPTNGVFEFIQSPATSDAQRFYRSVLLP